MYNVTWYLYPYYDIETTEIYNWNAHLKPDRKQSQYQITQYTNMAKPTFGMCVF